MNPNVEALLKVLPKKIKVGAYDWHVKILEGNDKCGEADFEFHHINLWPEALVDAAHTVGIVIHELLHVIYDNEDLHFNQVGSVDPDALEEEIVVGYEQGLVALYRDNPRLLTWIKKGLK